MKISLDWLSQYVDVPFTPKALDHRLTMLGIEVEGIEDFASKFDKIVVGEVLEAIPHPDADKLRLTRVSIGNGEPLRIVCGAPNARAGLKVAVATIGADLGEGFVIKKSKIRGEVSEGMLCSERELGLSESHEGILELPAELAVGVPLAQALQKQDVVLEIGITPNRPDCLSHIGLAREIAVITGATVRRPKVTLQTGNGSIFDRARVTIQDPELCPRYAARMVTGVTIGPSPEWLKRRVESVGLRSINNVVDVTNFVLMEVGHPLHAFDFGQITDRHVIVRRAEGFAKEFVTLDGKKRTLAPETLLISDPTRPLAIAGIMGGQNSEISESTTEVFIESAYFNPRSIRRSSKLLGLNTDASYRFERGTDPEIVLHAVDRAAQLIAEVAGGTILDGLIDENPIRHTQRSFSFRPARANALLGTQFEARQMRDVLVNLGLEVTEEDQHTWILTSPSYRVDLEIEEDAIEEVARVIGYEELPTSVSEPTALPMKGDPLSVRSFDSLVRTTLLSLGCTESVSTPLVSRKEAQLFAERPVELINPLNVDMDRMRSSLAINLLDIARRNERFGASGQRIFEVGSVFSYAEKPQLLGNVDERQQIGVLLSGTQEPKSPYNTSDVPASIYHITGLVKLLCERLGRRDVSFTAADNDIFHRGESICIEIGKTVIGHAGRVSADLLKVFDLKHDCYLALIEHAVLHRVVRERMVNPAGVSPLPKFPHVERDLALVLDENIKAQTVLERAVSFVDRTILEHSSIFDEFRSPEMKQQGERSLGIRLRFRSKDRTLEEAEVDQVMKNVVHGLQSELNARLRS